MQLGKTIQVENVVDVDIDETLPTVVKTDAEAPVEVRETVHA